MERELFQSIYHLAKRCEAFHFSRVEVYEDSVIVAVYFWAVIHDRPVDWATDAANWPAKVRKQVGRLPSQPTMSRRMGTVEVQRLLVAMEGKLLVLKTSQAIWLIDGKPLTVGPYSKDPDAAWGRAASVFGKGYKLHAIFGSLALPATWEIAPLNLNEGDIGLRLIARHAQRGYLLGDREYDTNALHHIAWQVGLQLLAPKQRGDGLGHCRHAPGRLRCLEILTGNTHRRVARLREQVERRFGWLTNHSGGLAPLPAWVRRIHRVRWWVQAKLISHAVYSALKQGQRILADE